MSVEQDIRDWDGKSASDIAEIYKQHCSKKDFITDLIKLSSQTSLQAGSTWLIKYHLEEKHPLSPSEASRIYRLLPQLESWEARLHILQCMPEMPIGEKEKPGVELFLRRCLVDDNKFVRAWAYNGFHELSLQYPEYKDEVRQFLEMAMRDEAPSVKARIRNILNKAGPDIT